MTSQSYSDETAVAMDSAGNVYITGSTSGVAFGAGGSGSTDYLAKYNSNGTLAWDSVWSGNSSWGVTLDPSGNVYVCADNQVRKYTQTGTMLWSVALQAGASRAGGIAVDSSGEAYVTGFGAGSSQSSSPFVTKLSPTGALIWTQTIDYPAPANCYSIAVDQAGTATIVGTIEDYEVSSSNITRVFSATFSSTGQVLSNTIFGQPQDDHYAGNVAVDTSGDTYMTMAGGTPLFGAGDPGGCYLIKYDASHQMLWYRHFTYAGGAVSMALDPAGFEFVAGGTGVLEYDANGTLVESYSWPDGTTMAYGDGRLSVSAVDYINGLQSAYVADLVVPAVPEPSTLMLLGVATVGMLMRRRRRAGA